MDRIANEGVRFTHMHSTSSLCAPSRYSILTGNLPMRGSKPDGEWMLFNPLQLKAGQRTTAHLFADADYTTGYVGKVHLGGGLVKSNGVLATFEDGENGEIDWLQGIQQRSMLKCGSPLGYPQPRASGRKGLSLLGYMLG